MSGNKLDDYTFRFESSKTPENIYAAILDFRSWWSGLYAEVFEGEANKLSDEFTFRAGEGVHYSKQKLVDLIPNKKIVWLVTDSNLFFLENPHEWTGTKICFDISKTEDRNQVTFTHLGLVPKNECYKNCAGAWTLYLENLEEKIK
ncbi:MAG: SRPBCC domain-containing protein [Ginsengibacter sp.]